MNLSQKTVALFWRFCGSVVYGTAKLLTSTVKGLIWLLQTTAGLVGRFFRGFLLLLSIGGCLGFFLVIGPLGVWLLKHPFFLLLFGLLIYLLLFQRRISQRLTTFEWIASRYLYNLANYLKRQRKPVYRSYNHYRQAYADEMAQRERARREYWQRVWGEWVNSRTSGWQQGGQPGGAPDLGVSRFKQQYEEACRILEIPVSTDAQVIKRAYRKQAKRYHPDINKNANATAQFQRISQAYDFLSDEHIARYKRMTRN